MNITSIDELKAYMEEHVIGRDEAVEITGQTKTTFSNAVNLGYVPVFYRNQRCTLYLREEIEAYTEQKRERAENRRKAHDMSHSEDV